jgi:hypothetical protein
MKNSNTYQGQMVWRVAAAPICALMVILCVSACQTKREGASEAGNTKLEGNAQGNSQGRSQAVGVTPSDETRVFRGAINGTYRIEMRLVRAGDRLSGTYAYENVGTNINLAGTIDGQGKFTLQESDSGGNQTGVFKGEWKESESDPGAMLDGTWTKANKGEELTFYLVEQHVDPGSGLKAVAKQIREENKKKKYTLDAEYPQLEGSTSANVEKFNREVSGLITREVEEWRKDAGVDPAEEDDGSETMGDEMFIRYDVMLADSDLASIAFNISVYEHGAAHPSGYSKVVNYDLKNGRWLKLADLFQPGANYLETISSYSINDLKRQSKKGGEDEPLLDDQSIEEGASAKADNYQSWNITRKGLLVTFDAYQVGPYAAGPQTVLVPYAALKGIIRPDAPLAAFIK